MSSKYAMDHINSAQRSHNGGQEVFWQSLFNKYERRNLELVRRQHELQKRLDNMKCSMYRMLPMDPNPNRIRPSFGKLQPYVAKLAPIPESCSPSACAVSRNGTSAMANSCSCAQDRSQASRSSVFSIQPYPPNHSASVSHANRLHELRNREIQLEGQMTELLSTQKMYKDQLHKSREMCSKFQQLNQQLTEKNQKISDELCCIKLALRNSMEQMQAPLDGLQEDDEIGQSLDSLQKHLEGCCEHGDAENTNRQFNDVMRFLERKCAQLKQDIERQKLTYGSDSVCKCAMGDHRNIGSEELADDSLYGIARQLSRTLLEIEKCCECKKVSADVIDTVKYLKQLLDLLHKFSLKKGKQVSTKSAPSPKPPFEPPCTCLARQLSARANVRAEVPEPPLEPPSVPAETPEPPAKSECTCATGQPSGVCAEAPRPSLEPKRTCSARQASTAAVETVEVSSVDLGTETEAAVCIETGTGSITLLTKQISREPSTLSVKSKKASAPSIGDAAPYMECHCKASIPSIPEATPPAECHRKETIPSIGKAPYLECYCKTAFKADVTQPAECECKPSAPCIDDAATTEIIKGPQTSLHDEIEITTSKEAMSEVESVAEIRVSLREDVGSNLRIMFSVDGAGKLVEVTTEGPDGVIDTTLTYTESGNVDIVTEIISYPEEYDSNMIVGGVTPGAISGVSSATELPVSCIRREPSSEPSLRRRSGSKTRRKSSSEPSVRKVSIAGARRESSSAAVTPRKTCSDVCGQLYRQKKAESLKAETLKEAVTEEEVEPMYPLTATVTEQDLELAATFEGGAAATSEGRAAAEAVAVDVTLERQSSRTTVISHAITEENIEPIYPLTGTVTEQDMALAATLTEAPTPQVVGTEITEDREGPGIILTDTTASSSELSAKEESAPGSVPTPAGEEEQFEQAPDATIEGEKDSLGVVSERSSMFSAQEEFGESAAVSEVPSTDVSSARSSFSQAESETPSDVFSSDHDITMIEASADVAEPEVSEELTMEFETIDVEAEVELTSSAYRIISDEAGLSVSKRESLEDDSTLRDDVAEALRKANQEVMDALEQANKEVADALEKAGKDVESALKLALEGASTESKAELATRPSAPTSEARLQIPRRDSAALATEQRDDDVCRDICARMAKEAAGVPIPTVSEGVCTDVCAEMAKATSTAVSEDLEVEIVVLERETASKISLRDEGEETTTDQEQTPDLVAREVTSEEEQELGSYTYPLAEAATDADLTLTGEEDLNIETEQIDETETTDELIMDEAVPEVLEIPEGLEVPEGLVVPEDLEAPEVPPPSDMVEEPEAETTTGQTSSVRSLGDLTEETALTSLAADISADAGGEDTTTGETPGVRLEEMASTALAADGSVEAGGEGKARDAELESVRKDDTTTEEPSSASALGDIAEEIAPTSLGADIASADAGIEKTLDAIEESPSGADYYKGLVEEAEPPDIPRQGKSVCADVCGRVYRETGKTLSDVTKKKVSTSSGTDEKARRKSSRRRSSKADQEHHGRRKSTKVGVSEESRGKSSSAPERTKSFEGDPRALRSEDGKHRTSRKSRDSEDKYRTKPECTCDPDCECDACTSYKVQKQFGDFGAQGKKIASTEQICDESAPCKESSTSLDEVCICATCVTERNRRAQLEPQLPKHISSATARDFLYEEEEEGAGGVGGVEEEEEEAPPTPSICIKLPSDFFSSTASLSKTPHPPGCDCFDCLCENNPEFHGIKSAISRTASSSAKLRETPVMSQEEKQPYYTIGSLDSSAIEKHIQDTEKEYAERKQSMAKFQEMIKEVGCACSAAEAEAIDSKPLVKTFIAKQKSSFQLTLSGLQLALRGLQKKCCQKDHLIAAMTEELKLKSDGKMFDEILQQLEMESHQELQELGRNELGPVPPEPPSVPEKKQSDENLIPQELAPLVKSLLKCPHPEFPRCSCVTSTGESKPKVPVCKDKLTKEAVPVCEAKKDTSAVASLTLISSLQKICKCSHPRSSGLSRGQSKKKPWEDLSKCTCKAKSKAKEATKRDWSRIPTPPSKPHKVCVCPKPKHADTSTLPYEYGVHGITPRTQEYYKQHLPSAKQLTPEHVSKAPGGPKAFSWAQPGAQQYSHNKNTERQSVSLIKKEAELLKRSKALRASAVPYSYAKQPMDHSARKHTDQRPCFSRKREESSAKEKPTTKAKGHKSEEQKACCKK